MKSHGRVNYRGKFWMMYRQIWNLNRKNINVWLTIPVKNFNLINKTNNKKSICYTTPSNIEYFASDHDSTMVDNSKNENKCNISLCTTTTIKATQISGDDINAPLLPPNKFSVLNQIISYMNINMARGWYNTF